MIDTPILDCPKLLSPMVVTHGRPIAAPLALAAGRFTIRYSRFGTRSTTSALQPRESHRRIGLGSHIVLLPDRACDPRFNLAPPASSQPPSCSRAYVAVSPAAVSQIRVQLLRSVCLSCPLLTIRNALL